MTKLLGRLILGFSLSTTFAHADGGLLGSGARYSNVVGMQGAVQNRAAANSLYRQSMRDERESRRTHDHGLHRKAVREAGQARAADGQGRAFARAALQAFAATMAAGQVKESEAKDVDVVQLREIANTPNALEKELAELLDERELAGNDSGEAGFESAGDVEKMATAEAKVDGKLEGEKKNAREPAAASMAVGAATSPGAPGAALAGGSANAGVVTKPLALPKVAAANVVSIATDGDGGPTRNERADQIERDRKVFLKKLGVGKVPPAEVRADKESNIFDVVHTRYQTIRGDNGFMEYLEHPELALHKDAHLKTRTDFSPR